MPQWQVNSTSSHSLYKNNKNAIKINYPNTSGKDHDSLSKPSTDCPSSVKYSYNKTFKKYLQFSKKEREQMDALNLQRWCQREKR